LAGAPDPRPAESKHLPLPYWFWPYGPPYVTKKQLELGGRSIPFDLLNKAYTIFFFAATYIFGCSFVLAILEPGIPILDLVFEEVSAFCTVGLSRGPTLEMGQAGRAILMLSMFVGRVGTLTLAFALASTSENQAYTYPKAHVLIG